MKKLAVVNQRYGTEVNGGSEYYTKKLAEHLGKIYDVEVLTTTALDYDTWAPYYEVGQQAVNGVRVRRFALRRQRNMLVFRIVNKILRTMPCFWKILEPLWIKVQGPYCPDLIRYIRKHEKEYDAFIFVTYLYYTTVMGLPQVAKKAILVPTAHEEYCIYFHIYDKLFKSPRGIVYLTEEEQSFVQEHFKNETVPHQIAGSGVDISALVDAKTFRDKYRIDSEYVIYVGRVDAGKNCDELFQFFQSFSEKISNKVALVVVGKMMMERPRCQAIRVLGFLPEADKYSAIAGAKALLMPSAHESLSLVVLEAMALGVPVVVNGVCEVLEGHCRKSGAGISYRNYEQFEEALERLIRDEALRMKMKEAGKRYVRENYNWDKTVEKYRELIESN